jgi:hypothetical protein
MKDKDLVNELWKLWENMAEAGQLTISNNFSKRYDELSIRVKNFNEGHVSEAPLKFCLHCQKKLSRGGIYCSHRCRMLHKRHDKI